MGRLCYWVLAMLAAWSLWLPAFGAPDPQSGPATTTVADTVFLADGTLAQGSLIITWPAFVTASGAAVAAGNTNVTLAANGTFSVALVPNTGATPAGVYYTVVYQIGPGEVKTEYWVVPTTSPANLATVRTTPGAGGAQPAVSLQYVNSALATKANDSAVVHLAGTETISGTKTFSAAPSVPAPTSAGQVATKGYVDSSVANVGAGNYLPTAGGTMTGPITLPANPAAPMQASTKQYVDTGMAAKADLVAGLVPASELGTGSATAGSCLVGSGTSSGSWGACGGGSGTGNLSTTPAASQNIAQPAGTEFSSNNFANIRYVTANWNWTQTPADNLGTAGSHTIHLSPCPLGLDTSNNTHAPYAVYVSGTGTPEAATVTGGSCPAGTASGTITVTTAYGHASGYTVGSASTGIQEAINDNSGPHGVIELLPASGSANPNYIVYAPVFLHTTRARLSGYGALVECYTRQVCILNGDQANQTGYLNTIEGMEFTPGLNIDGVQISSVSASSGVYTITTASNHPFVTGDWVIFFYSTPAQTQEARIPITVTAANQFQYQIGSNTTFASSSGYGWAALENAALEDQGDHVVFKDIKLLGPTGTQFFSWGIVFGNDQSAKIDGLTNEGSNVIKCTSANFCGAMVYGRGDQGAAPVIAIDHLEASMQCNGNGVRYVPGNVLNIENSVVQGFNQYGIYYGGGLQPLTVSTTYQESSGGCYNFSYPGSIAAQAGILTNSNATILSDDPIGGALPAFVAANSGSQQNNYFVAIHSSNYGNMGMYYIGGCATTGTGNCTTYWPEPNLDWLGTVTYDVLVTTGAAAVPPNGTGSYAVATGISGNCSTTGICTFADPQTGTSSYTVGSPQGVPKFNFWPGGIVLGGAAHLNLDNCGQGASIVTTSYLPSVFCNHGVLAGASQHSPYFASYLSGDSSGNANTSVGATLRNSGGASGTAPSAEKGLLNFISFGELGQADLITFADCNPFLTLATGGYRPTWSSCDTALGFDSAPSSVQGSAGLFLRAPASISQYINALPTGSNWLERLTAAGKTFNVPVTVNGNLAVSGGAVTVPITGTTQCLHVSATGLVSGTGADCGSGTGSVTVNSGVTSQLAMYSGNGTAVSGDSTLTDNGTTLNYTGSGGITAATGTFSGNLTVNGQLMVAGPWGVSSPIPGTAMAAASAGTSALGISNDGNFYISADGGTPQKVATSATSSYFSNLWQEDANELDIRNGAGNYQIFTVNAAGSYIDASDYSRLQVDYDTTNAAYRFLGNYLGTGTGIGSHPFEWCFGATSSPTCAWTMNNSSPYAFWPTGANATEDIGGATYHNVRDLYLGRSLYLNGSAGTSGQCPISAGAGSPAAWGSCAASSGVPTGVASGSALVSNGVSQQPIYQTKMPLDVRDYGAMANVQTATGASPTIASSGNTVTLGSSLFAAGDVGKTISIPGAGAAAPTNTTATTATTGGTIPLSTQVYYKISDITATGEGAASTEASVTTGSGTSTNTVTVPSPASGTGLTAWFLYASTSSGLDVLQSNAGCASPVGSGCAIGTSWTITSLAVAGKNPEAHAQFVTTISGYSSGTQVTVSANAFQTASSASVTWATDSTSAIQNAINAAGSAGGGAVAFPPGNFYLSSGLTLPDVSGGACANLQGAGMNTTFLYWWPNTGTLPAMLTGPSTNLTTGCSIRGLTLKGNAEVSNGIVLPLGKAWSVESVHVVDATGVSVLLGTTAGTNGSFYEEYFSNLFLEFSTGNFAAGSSAPSSAPSYCMQLLAYATDAKYINYVCKNASVAGSTASGGDNTFVSTHTYGYPLATYSPAYSFEDNGLANKYIGFAADEPSVSGFHFKPASQSTATGGMFYWADTTTFPSANFATYDSGSQGTSISNSTCQHLPNTSAPITGSIGSASAFYGIVGCTASITEYLDTGGRTLTVGNATFTGTVTIPSGASISGYAPLASPTFTGTPTVPGYLTTSAASSTYAPLASPTFTGTVTIPSGASIASPALTGTPTAPTASAGTSTIQVATTAFVAASMLAPSVPFVPFPGYNTSNQTVFPTSGSTLALWQFTLPYAKTTTKVAYKVAGTADNSANTYEISIYNASGTLVLSYQAAGTSFAPTASTMYRQSWTQGSTTLAPGIYYLGLSSSCTSSCATFYGSGGTTATYYSNTAFSGATSGTANPTITAPGSGYESMTANVLSVILE